MKQIEIPARLFRAGSVEHCARPDGSDDDRRLRLSFSSEAPVERMFGFEILGHAPGEMDLGRLAAGVLPLLLDHRATIDSQVGVVESATVEGGRGIAIVRFGKSARAVEILDRVRDGEITGVSVGYQINAAERTGTRDGIPEIRATSWTPLEISLVSVPADQTVGIGRSKETIPVPLTVKVPDMPAPDMSADENTGTPTETCAAPAPAVAAQATPDATDHVRADRARAREIAAMGKRFKLPEADIEAAIDSGASVADFGRKVLDTLGSADATAFRANAGKVGLTEKEVKRFSLVNAIRYLSDPNDSRARKAAGFEIEVSEAAAARSGANPKGLLIPADILSRNDFATGARAADLTAGAAVEGGNLIATDLLSGSFIDLLRKRSAIMRANVTMLGGLVGNIAIPKQTNGATAYWVGEDTAPTQSGATFGQVPMTPRTIGAFTEISRRLLIQSSIDVEALVRRDLATVVALEIDNAALNGSADVDAPNGLADVAGIGAVTFASPGAPTFEEMVALETVIAADDADVSAMTYIFNAVMRGGMKTRALEPGAAERVMTGGMVNGYPAIVSNQALAGDVWFGNFADFIVGMWSGLDLTVDPYSASTTGAVRVIAFQDVDFAVRHAESFAKGK